MNLLQMSLSGAVMILVIIVIRALAINKLPKMTFLVLWGVVVVRLLIPYSLSSTFSVYSLLEQFVTTAETANGSPAVPSTPMAPTFTPTAPTYNAIPIPGTAATNTAAPATVDSWMVVWVVGVLACAVFFSVAYWKCHKEFKASLPVDNEYTKLWLSEHRIHRSIEIRQSDRISAPLTYGVFRPVILMPKTVDWDNLDTLKYVLTHEYMHIRRFDAVTKLVLTVALCIHWFNPAVWIMYVLANRDIELSCDESVVRQFGERTKSAYAMTLIRMEETRSSLTPFCNNFNKNAIEERIIAIMKIKKTSFLVVVLAVIVCTVVAVCFLTGPVSAENKASQRGNSVVKWSDYEDEAEKEMIPTAANVKGAFDKYLYVPLEDGTYRYERSEIAPTSVTIGELLYSFVEKANPFDVEWNVYAVKESPNHRIVYVTAGDDYIHLYQYSPSKRIGPDALQNAKENGCIVMEDGSCTWGAEQWAEFYQMVQSGKSASVKVAHYYTLDSDRCDATYYEAHKEDYPTMYVNDLVYDGKTFTLSWAEQGSSYQRQYKYLMKYEDTIPTGLSSETPQAVTLYVLTNDNTVTWDELLQGLFSSQFAAYIDHFQIYKEISTED